MRARYLDWLVVARAYLVALGLAFAIGFWLKEWDTLWKLAAADFAATVAIFSFSLRFQNSSVYDPYWSVAPVPIALYLMFSSSGALSGFRPWLVMALVLWWAIRLTWNWLRRWQGLSHEDWRYQDIRARSGRAYWAVSFLGIHLMPTVVVFLGCLPLLAALGPSPSGLGLLDLLAFCVTAGAIWLESEADRQLVRFLRSHPAPGAFLDTGLWALCRHPNYLGEILFWWGLYLFGLAADPSCWWTLLGPVAVTLLFVFVSVPMMDQRMRARKPAYAAHMRACRALLPLPRRR